MHWVFLLICLVSRIRPGKGVYHVQSSSWLEVNFTSPDAYFGYSVTYEPTSKRLVVGAPQEDNIGAVYSCDLTSNKCFSLTKDNTTYFRYPGDNASQWLGATVKAGPSFVVTCAPRRLIKYTYIRNIHEKKRTQVGTFSKCYKYTNLTESTFETLRTISKQDRERHTTLFEHVMDSFGWSIDVDGEDIIIGGPAMFTGRVESYQPNRNEPISVTGFMDEKNANNSDRRIQYNFGYSVVVGYFRIGAKTKTYAIGSPYGKNGLGKGSTLQLNNLLRSQEDLTTDDQHAVGSMFGAVLCAARLTLGSNDTSLLVGAPAYAATDYNRGAVYIYPPAVSLPLKKLQRKIVGPRNSGFFGRAIAALGDFNGDGLDEIAIAAPYQDIDAGAVYIYSSKDINSPNPEITYIQQIVASPAAGLMTSFGFSLTKVDDFDENGCNADVKTMFTNYTISLSQKCADCADFLSFILKPELAIGAPESNKVMLLKCIASITVKVRAIIPKDLSLRDDNIFRTKDHFFFESCLDVTFPEKPDVIFARIAVNISLNHPDVELQTIDKAYIQKLENKGTPILCRNIKVSAPKSGNYQRPIIYEIIAVQLDPPEESMINFEPKLVSLSDRSNLKTSGVIYLNECKDKDHCMSKLMLSKSISVTSPYEIGSSDSIKLITEVKNDGEAAYGACLRIAAVVVGVSNDGVAVVDVPSGCERDHGRTDALVCRPPGPLRDEDEPWNTKILFDSSRLNSEHKFIKISIHLYNDCSQKDFMEIEEFIELKTDLSKISIKGITDAGVSNSVNMSKDDIDGKTFEHSYIITSEGLTNWVNLEIKVVGESRPFLEYEPISISTGISENGMCTMGNSNETVFTCIVKELDSKNPAKIIIPMKIISPELLENAINAEQNTVTTSIELKLNGDTKPARVTSILNLGGHLNIWIIVVASLVALLILIIFFCILRKRGFFRREKKTELENVRRSVRRQTMMRRTMVEGLNVPPGSDQQSLLVSVPLETAEQAAARDHRVRLDSNTTRNRVDLTK